MQGAELEVGDLVLVRQTAWKGKHKIQDRWESDEYQVKGKPTPGIHVYKVQCVKGGRTRILHRNQLKKDAFADLKSKVSSDFRSLSDRIDADESSEEKELYTDSLTTHTTATDLTTIGNLSSSLGPITSRVEEPSIVSQTESQFSPSMPYLEETIQSDNTSTEDSVFTSHSNNVDDTHHGSQITSPASPIPRRSTRSTKGKPLERYGQVYTFGTIINNAPECPRYRQTIYIPCYDYC